MKEKYFLTVKLVTNTGGSVNTLYIEKNLCDGDKVIGRYRNIIVTRLNNSKNQPYSPRNLPIFSCGSGLHHDLQYLTKSTLYPSFITSNN